MKPIVTGSFILSALFCCSISFGHPILLTISETENGQSQSWWPNQIGSDSYWLNAFERQGVALVHPEKLANPPRLSPTVYGQSPLSDVNARTLASLFGSDRVLNGNVTWSCASQNTAVSCKGTGNFHLLTSKQKSSEFVREYEVSSWDADSAKQIILTRFASELAQPIMQSSDNQATLPKLLNKPVIVFDPLPDADALVAIRKALKRVPGVEDVAERWVSDGTLAVELNPEKKEMSQSDFLLIIQGFMNENIEGLLIRASHQNDLGAVFEVVKL